LQVLQPADISWPSSADDHFLKYCTINENGSGREFYINWSLRAN